MSALVLSDAVEAMFPPDFPAQFEAVKPNEQGQVLADALPWVVVRVRLPEHGSRVLAGRHASNTVGIVTTIAGETFDAVRIAYDRTEAVLLDRRPIAPGWATTPVRQMNLRDIVEDESITIIGTNAHPVFTTVEWTFTATALAS